MKKSFEKLKTKDSLRSNPSIKLQRALIKIFIYYLSTRNPSIKLQRALIKIFIYYLSTRISYMSQIKTDVCWFLKNCINLHWEISIIFFISQFF